MAAKITLVDITSDGHLYVEVNFGGCINDFIFVNVPLGGYGPATDNFGRRLSSDPTQTVFIPHDISAMVIRAVTAFKAEITTKGHKGDMRDKSIKLGGADKRGFKNTLKNLVLP